MPSQPVTAVLIGAGQRGAEAYAPYALQHPDQLRFVAVAEPDPQRRARFAAQHHIPRERQYTTWEDLLDEPQMADAALICTQDTLHTAPALAAMRAGYHILLEKPLAPRLEECERLVATSEATGRQLHVGHVMRYTRHYRLLREIVQSGVLGQIVDVDHRENVAFWHMAHSYVRGNWRNQALSSPMILAKCCHDLDMLPWALGQRCRRLYSVGSLLHFRPENAPPGAPERCLDGCPAAETCPYYAPYIYLEMKPFWHNYAETAPRGIARWATQQQVKRPGLVRALSRVYPDLRQITEYRGWPLTVLALDPTPENLLEALRLGPYGRCVYHCDNDVVDHQVVSMVFDNGTTVTLTMHGHSHVEHRSTRIEGTRGRLMSIAGNGGGWIQVEEHRTLTRRTYDTSPPPGQGHGGGDMGLMEHFVACVRAGGNPAEVLQTAREALESHRLAFAAEESRLTGRVFTFE
ncbi:hypothetical protein SE15_08960 [Thermanaerothrix daxensis]|uniref:Oxidoreductase n=2 Tax=Thermanaerothrix daxensis TaxID=869279 RepID=A0A0N8GQ73_9CHLR|nr:hypothetical protein SE15_08960 [Thermanaerothrix daxensis]